jgi:hypothetical protein
MKKFVLAVCFLGVVATVVIGGFRYAQSSPREERYWVKRLVAQGLEKPFSTTADGSWVFEASGTDRARIVIEVYVVGRGEVEWVRSRVEHVHTLSEEALNENADRLIGILTQVWAEVAESIEAARQNMKPKPITGLRPRVDHWGTSKFGEWEVSVGTRGLSKGPQRKAWHHWFSVWLKRELRP